MDLRQIEYVLAVVERGSFTKAAASMQVSQPSLSDGIRRLETELGVRLFHRLGRSVELTDAGRAFVGPARQLTRDRDAVFESVATVRDLRSGTLDIVSLPTLAADPLGRLVGGFRKANPGISVRIAAPEDDGAVVAMVLDGRSELGLTELRAHRDELVGVSLERQELVAVCPPRTRLATSGRLPVARLRGMPLVTTPPGTSTRDLLDRALASAGVEPHIAVETSQREAIAPLVLSGAGTSFLPARLAEPLAAQGAVIARLVPTLTRTIGLVHRPSPLTPAARAFVELARPKRRG
ncbi:MAG TPA: LysR substrate-binding domain-containing protein [Acidimicrobiia bacterium]|jgi:DNA-binding transcriptional LysR family regulator|nr:LysR substrate-binding domain-containing protein [Acidimicrobiia bacterium]